VLIDFSLVKDQSNCRKHGVSLDLARQLDWLAGRVQPARTVGGEVRWKMIAALASTVFVVIFTRRGEVFWIISLRRASRKERRDYGRQ
jgi:uncharacterized DUF497 family protein